MSTQAFLQAKVHNPEKQNSGEVRGETYDIGCLSWCNANRKITPVAFKYVGADNMVYTVRDIHVKTANDKFYSGLPSKEYECEAAVGGFMREFKLIYFIEESRWVMRI